VEIQNDLVTVNAEQSPSSPLIFSGRQGFCGEAKSGNLLRIMVRGMRIRLPSENHEQLIVLFYLRMSLLFFLSFLQIFVKSNFCPDFHLPSVNSIDLIDE